MDYWELGLAAVSGGGVMKLLDVVIRYRTASGVIADGDQARDQKGAAFIIAQLIEQARRLDEYHKKSQEDHAKCRQEQLASDHRISVLEAQNAAQAAQIAELQRKGGSP